MIDHGILHRLVIQVVGSLIDVVVLRDALRQLLELIVIHIKLIYQIIVVHLQYRHIVGIEHCLLSQVYTHLVVHLRHVGHQHVEL
jgi:hypothetical protein